LPAKAARVVPLDLNRVRMYNRPSTGTFVAEGNASH
jgi:hypothetical protein